MFFIYSLQSFLVPPRAFPKLACSVSCHTKVSFCFSSFKSRINSLTIGDSERKSSGPQQREPTAEIISDSTGNCDLWWVIFSCRYILVSFNVTPPLITASSSSSPPGTGLVHRCVVVQKDQLGFGFTVCGERVKLVQNVRPGETEMLRLRCHRNVDSVKRWTQVQSHHLLGFKRLIEHRCQPHLSCKTQRGVEAGLTVKQHPHWLTACDWHVVSQWVSR